MEIAVRNLHSPELHGSNTLCGLMWRRPWCCHKSVTCFDTQDVGCGFQTEDDSSSKTEFNSGRLDRSGWGLPKGHCQAGYFIDCGHGREDLAKAGCWEFPKPSHIAYPPTQGEDPRAALETPFCVSTSLLPRQLGLENAKK